MQRSLPGTLVRPHGEFEKLRPREKRLDHVRSKHRLPADGWATLERGAGHSLRRTFPVHRKRHL